jgi:hypothetical protein
MRPGRRRRRTILLAVVALAAALPVAPAAADDTTPPAPFSLVAPASGAYLATATPLLTWNATTDDTLYSYTVVMDANPDEGDVSPQSCPAPAVCSFQMPAGTPLAEGTHTWRVVAYDDWNNSTDPGPRSFVVDTQPPVAPQITSATSQSVRWTASSDATSAVSYQVVLDGSVIAATAETAYASTAADPSADHVWRIVASDQAGNRATSAPLSVRGTPRRPGSGDGTGPPAKPLPVGPTAGPSVVIDHGARFTATRTVHVALTWPSDATHLLLSNQRLAPPGDLWRPLTASARWRLAGTGLDGRPSSVYAAFAGGGGVHGPVRAQIVLDLARPTLARAVRRGRTVRLWARDRVSGLARMQAAADRAHPSKAVAFAPLLELGPRTRADWVRVVDAAGNHSAWRRVATR